MGLASLSVLVARMVWRAAITSRAEATVRVMASQRGPSSRMVARIARAVRLSAAPLSRAMRRGALWCGWLVTIDVGFSGEVGGVSVASAARSAAPSASSGSVIIPILATVCRAKRGP